MTVCIAARALHRLEARIVMCCDLLVGDDLSTTETTFKCDVGFAVGLAAMFAGPVLEVNEWLRGWKKTKNASKPLTVGQLLKAVNNQMDKFNKRRDSPTEAQFLICGFLERQAVIVYVTAREAFECLDHASIGVGAAFSDSLLRWRYAFDPLNPFDNVRDVLYRVYEAKRFSEASRFVGRATILASAYPMTDGRIALQFMPPQGIDFLKGQYEKLGPQLLPKKREYFSDFPNVISDTSGHSGRNS